jgi:hypothetical protein
MGGLHLPPSSHGHSRTRDFLPDLDWLGDRLAIGGGREPMVSRVEVLGDRTIRGQEALRMPSGLALSQPCCVRWRGLSEGLRTLLNI